MRSFLPTLGLVFLGFHSIGAEYELIKDAIIDIEQACALGEHEKEALSALAEQRGEDLNLHQENLAHLLEKLATCRGHLVEELSYCPLDTSDYEEQNHQTTPTPQKTMLAKIASGCDWLIRVASVLWAFQILYGYL